MDQAVPATGQQQLVLATIRDIFREYGVFPTHEYLESTLQDADLEINDVLPSMPIGWFSPDSRPLGGVLYFQPDQEIKLTILGLYRCPGSDDLLALLAKGIQWGVSERLAYRPSLGTHVEPEWTFTDFVTGVAEIGTPTHDVVFALELMRLEPDLPRWSGPTDDPQAWKIHIPRDIRRWKHLSKIETYVRSREEDLMRLQGHITAGDQLEDTSIRSRGQDNSDMTKATVFVVHGHDERRKHEVARTLRNLTGEEAIIFHEQPDRGQTIIEKFERHAREAAFAVVLLTGDDLGSQGGNAPVDLRRRARQNVVFELGFFIGAMGRNRVVALYESGVELPSDLDGVLYTKLDIGGAWKTKLARELRASGMKIDPDGLLNS